MRIAPVADKQPAPTTDLAAEKGTALALIAETKAALIYAPGALTALVDRLKAEVRCQLSTLDVSIPADRARIISLSAKVGTAKAELDRMGESLIEDARAVVTAVNADRKAMRDELAAFKIEVRKPVTDIEDAEKNRITAHEEAISVLRGISTWDRALTLDEIGYRIESAKKLFEGRSWEEFGKRAGEALKASLYELESLLQRTQRAIREQEEAERLRVEAAERAIKEREESAAKAAKEAAERKAAEQARLAQEAAERERLRVENERAEAESRAKQAEAQRIAQEALAERLLAEAEARRVAEEKAAAQRAKEAQERAERERLEAVDNERKRVAEEKRKEVEEAEKRAKNKARQAAVNRDILTALAKLGIPEDIGREVVIAMAKGQIPHVTVAY
jgi:colicin import membrane protein